MNRHTAMQTGEYSQDTNDPGQARLRRAIARDLDQEDRLLVVLRYAERMSFREIALVLGMPTEQAEHRLAVIEHRLQTVA